MVVLRADISPGSSRTTASETGGRRRQLSDAAFVTLWPGETIGRYEIMSLLGCGALGPTYCARDRTLGRDVVVKEFLPWTLALRPDGVNVVAHPSSATGDFDWMRARFVEEGARLRDLPPAPFVARAIDAFDANGTSCIVFNLVPGISLERRVRTGGVLRAATVERLLGSLVEALSHLHDQGLLHGDIRPANVIVDLSGRPTLIDFGNARTAIAQRLPELAASRPLAYTAPELSLGGPATAATDIYALAATVHYAITGRAPPAASERLQADRYEPLAGLAPSGFAREMLTAIDRALTLHPGDRPQSIPILRALLRPRTSGRSGSARSRFSRLWMAAAAAVAPRR